MERYIGMDVHAASCTAGECVSRLLRTICNCRTCTHGSISDRSTCEATATEKS